MIQLKLADFRSLLVLTWGVLKPLVQFDLVLQMTSKGYSKPKSEPAQALEWKRAIPMDLRDPRALQDAWPCFGRHNESEKGSNKHGMWVCCSVCGLRTNYVPREGSPATSQQSVDFARVTQALDMLKRDLKDVKPHSRLVTAAVELVMAQEKYNFQMVHPPKEKLATPRASTPAAKALSPPPRSTASWTPVDAPTTELSEENLIAHMSNEELAELRRRVAASTPMPLENPNQGEL